MKIHRIIPTVSAFLIMTAFPLVSVSGEEGPWPAVPQAPESSFDPELYTEDELYLNVPYYLKHLHRLANAVVESGENRGFIDLHVWRSNFATWNFRTLENHTAFAYFYATDTPWNPYYGSEALRMRLEATLALLNERSAEKAYHEWPGQRERGRFGAASVSFGLAKLMRTLEILQDGPGIDPEIHDATRETARRMIFELFEPGMFRRGTHVSNQLDSIWYSAVMYVDLFGDPEIEALMQERLPQSEAFQSPAGFFYESASTEWGYNLKTHKMILNFVAAITGGRPLLSEFLHEREARFWEWVAYSVAGQPGSDTMVLNGGIQSRHLDTTDFEDLGYIHAAGEMSTARAFAQSRESFQKVVAERRSALAESGSAAIAPLAVGSSRAYHFPIYALMMDLQFPSEQARSEARAGLPFRRDGSFVHQRADIGRFDPPYAATFVKRPGYYAVFNSGELNKPFQRVGLGLLWHPEFGVAAQNVNALTKDEDELAERPSWGTARKAMTEPLEGRRLAASFTVDGEPVDVEEGARDLPSGELGIAYPLGDSGRSEWTFGDEGIEGRIRLDGGFVHQIPLLIGPEEEISVQEGRAVLERSGVRMEVAWSPASKGQWEPTRRQVGDVLRGFLLLSGEDDLSLTVRFVDGSR